MSSAACSERGRGDPAHIDRRRKPAVPGEKTAGPRRTTVAPGERASGAGPASGDVTFSPPTRPKASCADRYVLIGSVICTLIRTLKLAGTHRIWPEPAVTTVLSRTPPKARRHSGVRYDPGRTAWRASPDVRRSVPEYLTACEVPVVRSHGEGDTPRPLSAGMTWQMPEGSQSRGCSFAALARSAASSRSSRRSSATLALTSAWR